MVKKPPYGELEKEVKELEIQAIERKRAEETISHAKNEWEQVFFAVPDLIMILDDRYRMVGVNKAMADRLDITPDEAVGLTCYERIHGKTGPPPFCPHTKLLLDGQGHMDEVHEERLGGDFLVTVSPLHDREGNLIGSVHVARDITQQKQTEQALKASEKRSREMAELLPQPVFELDMEGRFTYANRIGLDTFGYTGQELEGGVHALQLFHPKDRDRVMLNIGKRLKGIEFEDHEYIGLRKDGTTFPILIYTSPITRDQKIIGVRGIVLDITERKQAEQALKGARDELEQRVRERTKELNSANERMKLEIEERKHAEEEKEKLIRELHNALENIRTLRGLLPICSKCKKIRDDKGYWNRIENYIESHSEALFSHGLCPDCLEHLYGNDDWYKKRKK